MCAPKRPQLALPAEYECLPQSALVDELDRRGIATLDELSETHVLRGISQTLELSLAELAATAGGSEARDHFVSLAGARLAWGESRALDCLGLGVARVQSSCTRCSTTRSFN